MPKLNDILRDAFDLAVLASFVFEIYVIAQLIAG